MPQAGRTIEEIFSDKKIREAVESAVAVAHMAGSENGTLRFTISLDKRLGGHTLEYSMYRNGLDPPDVLASSATWDSAPTEYIRAVELLIRSMIPQLQHHWEIWYRGEGKKRALFDRRVISQYTNGMQIDWPNVSLIATIDPLLLGNTDELDLNEWKIHKGDSVSPGKHLRIPCRFDDLKLVIYYQDVVLSVFKRNGYLVPVK